MSELDPTAKHAKVKSSEKPTDDPESERLRKHLSLAKERFKLASEAEAQNRRESLDDLEFRTGKQWPDDILSARTATNKPCLTMNRLPAILRQVTNQQRRERPSVQINPVGSGATSEIAEILQGMVRHVEVGSDAEIPYDDAFESMVCIGFGFWRLITEYVDGDSDDQEIKIKRVKNPFSVYFDPSAIEPDYSDAKWAFVVEDFTKEEYKNSFPGSKLSASLEEFGSVGDNMPGWITDESVRVAEYFWVDETQENSQEGERPKSKRKVNWEKINSVEVLEKSYWAGKWIPLVPVLGDDLSVNGKRYLAGLVRNVKDAMRMYNYHLSAATQAVALAPLAPFVIAEGQMENHEPEWTQANTKTYSALVYKNVQGVPPPQRNTAEPAIEAITSLTKQADNDIKAITGIYDASLGQPGPEQSAKAILARKQQGDVSTSNWSDNLARSLRHSGRILVDLIPHIYDAARIQRIINPDQTVDQVGVFNSQKSGMSMEDAQQLPEFQGIKKIYDIGVGRYDVTVTVGPSYQSMRQEAVASIMALLQAYPNMTPIIGDLLVRQMDIPFAKQIADRLEKTLPPGLKDDDDQDAESKLNSVHQQLAQMSQQNQALSQHLNQAIQTINTKQVEQQAKIEVTKIQESTKLTIAQMTLENQRAIAEITTAAQDLQERRKLEQDAWVEQHSAAHDVGTQAADHAQEQNMAAQSAQNDQSSQQSDQAHQADMATQAQDSQADQATQAQEAQAAQAKQSAGSE